MPDRIYSSFLKRIVIMEVMRTYFRKKSYFMISGSIMFLTLIISVARAFIFLRWIETELYFVSRSWNEDDLSSYVSYS